MIVLDRQTAAKFQQLQTQFENIYIHGSYWVNLSSYQQGGHHIFRREIELVKRLGCTHFILHPGAALDKQNRQEGIDVLANILNKVTKAEPSITFILENTAHGGRSIGSDLQDFYHLKQKLNHPERIAFCIDTAHAHAYGYTITDQTQRDKFIETIDQTIGIDTIELIHLNDATHPCGSQIDKHAPLGSGYIGEQALKSFALDPRFSSIPLILELPILPKAQEGDMLQKVKLWHKK